MFIYDWILEPAILTYLLYYFFPSSSLLTHLFTQDSVSSSLRYTLSHLGLPIQPTEIFTLTKIIIFLSLSSIYYLSHLLTWSTQPYIYLYYATTLLTTPIILQRIYTHTQPYTQQLQAWQKRTLNHAGCLALAKSINYICQTNLNSNPRISATELEQVANLNDMTYIWTFLKILLTTTLIKYVKKSGSGWGSVLQYLYDGGHLIEVPKNQNQSIIIPPTSSHNSHRSHSSTHQHEPHNPKKILGEIVMKRKWYYFYDPNVLNMIIKIYQEGESTFLQDAMQSLKTQTFRFFSLWTLSNILPLPILAFILRIPDEHTNYPHNLIVPALDTGLILLFPTHIAKIAFFSEFIVYANKPAIIQAIFQSFSALFATTKILTRETRYNRFLALSIPTILFFSQFTRSINLPNPDHFPRLPYLSPAVEQLPTQLVTFTLLILTTKYNFIYLWLSIFGYFSNYSLPHLVTLNLLLYIIVNIINIHEIEEPQVKIDVIKSYWSQKPAPQHQHQHQHQLRPRCAAHQSYPNNPHPTHPQSQLTQPPPRPIRRLSRPTIDPNNSIIPQSLSKSNPLTKSIKPNHYSEEFPQPPPQKMNPRLSLDSRFPSF